VAQACLAHDVAKTAELPEGSPEKSLAMERHHQTRIDLRALEDQMRLDLSRGIFLKMTFLAMTFLCAIFHVSTFGRGKCERLRGI